MKKGVYEATYGVLMRFPDTRSNDNLLCAYVHIEFGEPTDQLRRASLKSCVSDESITRARRMIFKEHPELCVRTKARDVKELEDRKFGQLGIMYE